MGDSGRSCGVTETRGQHVYGLHCGKWWLWSVQVLCAELVPALDSVVVVAGSMADGKYGMRAWRVLGDEGCSIDALRLLPRACSQVIVQQEVATEAAVVVAQPEWAKLWNGAAAIPSTTMQGGVPPETPPRALDCRYCLAAHAAS